MHRELAKECLAAFEGIPRRGPRQVRQRNASAASRDSVPESPGGSDAGPSRPSGPSPSPRATHRQLSIEASMALGTMTPEKFRTIYLR